MKAAAHLDEMPFVVRAPSPSWAKGSERCYIIDSWLKSKVPRGKGRHEEFKRLRQLYTEYLESDHVMKMVAVDPEVPSLVVGWLVRVPPMPGCEGPVMEAWHTKAWAEPYEGLILEVMRDAASLLTYTKLEPTKPGYHGVARL